MHAPLPQEIIARKRRGETLRREDIEEFIRGYTQGHISDAQAAALAMAICFQGLDAGECATLTRAMAKSGATLDWREADLPGPVVDKHSTGGVGDVVSLIIAPAAAACGIYVPMIAGRSLGHTGGTIDKLEAIPGYMVAPGMDRFTEVVRRCGCAIIGQTADLAPADKKLYAVRDVTATVESIPLITASILAKKLAAGLEALVMDVKVGSGAFLPSLAEAQALANSISAVGAKAGLPVHALITDMDEPLAPAAGNALEVAVAIDFLTGKNVDPRLREVVLGLGSEMLLLGGMAESSAEASYRFDEALSSGAAAEYFARMVAALGGPTNLIERPTDYLSRAHVVLPVYPSRSGYVQKIDTRALGYCVVRLGGGRHHIGAKIDPSVGLSMIAKIGALVGGDAPLCMVHARHDEAAAEAAKTIVDAYHILEEPPRARRPCIVGRIGAAGK
jgi:thymidine phosphorylase